MDELSLMQRIAIWTLPLIFGITVHEVAHGWMARRLGDPTAMMLGRLTLNPVKHIDPVGTLLVPILMLILTPFVFGWAKPVPVTWENLKNPKRDMALVAFAGPASNLLMALFWALILKIGVMFSGESNWIATYMVYVGSVGVLINVVLAVLNLLPIPPLDGSRVLSAALPGPWAGQFSRLESYGFILLLLLLVTGVLGQILFPFVNALQSMYFTMVAL